MKSLGWRGGDIARRRAAWHPFGFGARATSASGTASGSGPPRQGVPEEAEAKAAQVDSLLLWLKQRLIELPPGVGVVEFVQHDGMPLISSAAIDGLLLAWALTIRGEVHSTPLARRLAPLLVETQCGAEHRWLFEGRYI